MLTGVTNLGVKANLNSIDDLGVYQATDVVNGPSGVTGYVFVHVTSANVGGNSRAVQKLWNLNSGTEYTRVKTIGGWTPWETGGGGGGGGDYDPLGTADAVMLEHVSEADPHPQYLTEAEATALYDETGAGTAAVATHVAETDPHSQYLNAARGDARYDPVGAADAAVSAHESELDPHTQYLTETRGDARYDAKGTAETEAASAVAAHVAETDPHSQYLNTSRGDARYDAVGAADAAVTAHESETDPHTQYYNQTRGDARYAALVHTHAIGDVTGLTGALAGKQDTLGFTPVKNLDYQASGDCNDFKTSGFVFVDSATNGPGGSTQVYLYIDNTFAATSQIGIPYNTSDIYVRTAIFDAWTPWKKLWNQGYTVSTSTPSGGADGDFWFQREA